MFAVAHLRLAERIHDTKKKNLAQLVIPSAMVGHVGDGHFYLVFMIDPNRPDKLLKATC